MTLHLPLACFHVSLRDEHSHAEDNWSGHPIHDEGAEDNAMPSTAIEQNGSSKICHL